MEARLKTFLASRVFLSRSFKYVPFQLATETETLALRDMCNIHSHNDITEVVLPVVVCQHTGGKMVQFRKCVMHKALHWNLFDLLSWSV